MFPARISLTEAYPAVLMGVLDSISSTVPAIAGAPVQDWGPSDSFFAGHAALERQWDGDK
jgi:hypothetical protein